MIKVLGLALYGRMAASTRYRLEQYAPDLSRLGIDLDINCLLGNEYLRRTFEGKSIPMASMVKSGWDRLSDLYSQSQYDVLLVHCELFPFMPGWIERRFLRKPYVYDFDDAFYLKYRTDRFAGLAPFLGAKFETIMAGAAAVTAGNGSLASYAARFCPSTHLLPTVVDTDRYKPGLRKADGELVVGWIGSPSTAGYLDELIGPLTALGEEGPVRLVVVGGKAPAIPNVTVDVRDWAEGREVSDIGDFDVGVMPLPDSEWARGKCAFKLIQYMASAIPVVASPVGANLSVVTAECGIFARSQYDWLEAFRLLRDQSGVAAAMGAAGRARAEEFFSLKTHVPVLADVIRHAVGKGTSCAD